MEFKNENKFLIDLFRDKWSEIIYGENFTKYVETLIPLMPELENDDQENHSVSSLKKDANNIEKDANNIEKDSNNIEKDSNNLEKDFNKKIFFISFFRSQVEKPRWKIQEIKMIKSMKLKGFQNFLEQFFIIHPNKNYDKYFKVNAK